MSSQRKEAITMTRRSVNIKTFKKSCSKSVTPYDIASKFQMGTMSVICCSHRVKLYFSGTVKPVSRGHPRERQKVAA